MLTQIKLKNFKIFKEETAFPLAKINLLTGINGAGKSTLLQALLLMRQSIEQAPYSDTIFLNGSCVKLGTAEEIMNDEQGQDSNIIFGFTYQLYGYIPFEIKYTLKKHLSEAQLLQINEIYIKTSEENRFYFGTSDEGQALDLSKRDLGKFISQKVDFQNLEDNQEKFQASHRLERMLPVNHHYGPLLLRSKNLLPSDLVNVEADFQKIHYISAARIAPKRFYPKESLDNFISVGGDTSNMTASVLSSKKTDNVDKKCSLSEEDAQKLEQATEAWLNYIFGDVKFKIDDSQTDIIYLLFKTKPDGAWQKPPNVGFGFSYVLPIIVSGLIAKEGEILIVENPEAHLHPRAQSKLTEFLSKVASTGVQVFIESHSEHILHGLQKTVINEDIDLSNKDVSILYFQEKEEGYFTQIPIAADGKIDQWEEGFFDQTEQDIDIILGI